MMSWSTAFLVIAGCPYCVVGDNSRLGALDYLAAGAASLVVAGAIILAVVHLVSPGEKSNEHIKLAILRDPLSSQGKGPK